MEPPVVIGVSTVWFKLKQLPLQSNNIFQTVMYMYISHCTCVVYNLHLAYYQTVTDIISLCTCSYPFSLNTGYTEMFSFHCYM